MESFNYDHEKPSKTLAKSDADVDTEAYTSRQQSLALKQHWSAYFTILAAAFGLISDGCKRPASSFSLILLLIFECTDQNNLMTMANVRTQACLIVDAYLNIKIPSP